MAMQRVAAVVTCGLVGGLAAVFAVIGWEQADRVASVVSALTAVGAFRLSVRVLLPGSGRGTRGRPGPEAGEDGSGTTTPVGTGGISAVRTGTAVASGPGSRANTGVTGCPAMSGPVIAAGTGDARATGGGAANSGIVGVGRRPHA